MGAVKSENYQMWQIAKVGRDFSAFRRETFWREIDIYAGKINNLFDRATNAIEVVARIDVSCPDLLILGGTSQWT